MASPPATSPPGGFYCLDLDDRADEIGGDERSPLRVMAVHPDRRGPCDEALGREILTLDVGPARLWVALPRGFQRTREDAKRDRHLAALGMTKVYVQADTLSERTGGAANDVREALSAAKLEAQAATLALHQLADRFFVKKTPRKPPLIEVSAPKIDDLVRAKARRALRRGGFNPGKSS